MRLEEQCSKAVEPYYSNEFKEAEVCPSCAKHFSQLIVKSQEREKDENLFGFNSKSFASIDWKDAKNTVIVVAALFATVISFVRLIEYGR